MDLINREVEKKLGIKIGYLLINCGNPNCGNSWGVRIWNSFERKEIPIKETDLICRECAMRKMAEEKYR